MGCDRLVRVLEVLLLLGNTLNAYGSNARASQVHGVTIHSLLQVLINERGIGREKVNRPLTTSLSLTP